MTPGTEPERRSRRAEREPSGGRAVRESVEEESAMSDLAAGKRNRSRRAADKGSEIGSGAARRGVCPPIMSPDAELLVIFGVLHLVALVLGGALFLMFLRSDSNSSWHQDDEDDSGGGGNDRVSDKPKTSPSGGIPLPFAVQSDRRLRSGTTSSSTPAGAACARAPRRSRFATGRTCRSDSGRAELVRL